MIEWSTSTTSGKVICAISYSLIIIVIIMSLFVLVILFRIYFSKTTTSKAKESAIQKRSEPSEEKDLLVDKKEDAP